MLSSKGPPGWFDGAVSTCDTFYIHFLLVSILLSWKIRIIGILKGPVNCTPDSRWPAVHRVWFGHCTWSREQCSLPSTSGESYLGQSGISFFPQRCHPLTEPSVCWAVSTHGGGGGGVLCRICTKANGLGLMSLATRNQ